MSKYIILFFSIINFASASTLVGECVVVPFGKKYIQNEFTAGYPRDVHFSCEYECRSENGFEIIIGHKKTTIRNQRDEAYQTTCQGVKLKVAAWGYAHDRTESFYAYLAESQEILNWAKINISRDNQFENTLLLALKKTLDGLVISYNIVSKSSAEQFRTPYKKAANELEKISLELPNNLNKLNYYIKKIKKNENISLEVPTAESLVKSAVRFHARWRLPIDMQ